MKITTSELNIMINNIEKDVAEIKDTLNKFIEKSDRTYSQKWVEKGVISIGVAVTISFLMAVSQLLTK